MRDAVQGAKRRRVIDPIEALQRRNAPARPFAGQYLQVRWVYHSTEHETPTVHAKHEHALHTELHDALKLNPSQETAWQAMTKQLKPSKETDHDKMLQEHKQWAQLSVPERFDRMLEHHKSHEERLVKYADAVKNFYATLTSDQQKIFDRKFRVMGPMSPKNKAHQL